MSAVGSLRLITGNRLETLAEELARSLLQPLSSPLEPEIVVVQSKGMEHWISMKLAETHGVCSNVRFPFPNRFLEEVHARVMPGPGQVSGFDPAELSWRIMRLLPGLAERPGFELVRSYLAGDTHGIRRLQLSRRIADSFDQYLVFRPDLVFSWELGRGEGWQPELWRELVREIGPGSHRAARARDLMERLESPGAADLLPERVSVFGISALPRFHMEILAGISRFTRVTLFLMNPCMEYWADIAGAREIARRTARDPERPGAGELHLESGNPLLASMGGMGRDFLSLVLDHPVETLERFEDPGEESLLRAVQSDILGLRDRTSDPEKTALGPGDDSVLVHVCHSPLREVEVLRDRLLELFEREPELLPGDVLVTMPDIEAYAPYIKAVFDTPDGRELRIPYTVADRSARRESEVIEAFLRLIRLADERYSLSGVLSVLESGPVMRRFGLSDTDLDRLRSWLVEAGVRWGLDREDRAGLGLPPFEEGTWRSGIKRLLLGYAMWGGGERLFAGILPYETPGGGEVDLLERFLEFASALLDSIPRLERPMPAADWERELSGVLERFLDPGDAGHSEILALQRALRELGRAGDPEGPDFGEDLSPAAVRSFLAERLDREAMGFGFMTGGVTFCAMVPMRSIPFRVICCLGMDSDSFPRAHRSPGFDLIARHPRPGDRSRRSDDRYLFLETLLSARDHLHLSYTGRSERDNSPIPPSVLVSELLDYIEGGFETSEGVKLMERLVVEHRLHPFNPAYFQGDERLFTYSAEHLRAAESLVRAGSDPPPLFDRELPPPGPEWNRVEVDDLVRFFKNPAGFLLKNRLGVVLEEREGLPEDREPYEIEGLDRYTLGEELVARHLAGRDLEAHFHLARASGKLPPAAVGRVRHQDLLEETEAFAREAGPFLEPGALPPLEVDLELGDFRLAGRLDWLYPQGIRRYRFARIKAGDRLSLWILHLVLCASREPESGPWRSVLMGLPPAGGKKTRWAACEYGQVEAPGEHLLSLLELYRQGLSRPLPFFPETSWEYARRILERPERPDREASGPARRTWEGSGYGRGEREDPYTALCFRGIDPVGAEEFKEIARRVFGPLRDHETRLA